MLKKLTSILFLSSKALMATDCESEQTKLGESRIELDFKVADSDLISSVISDLQGTKPLSYTHIKLIYPAGLADNYYYRKLLLFFKLLSEHGALKLPSLQEIEVTNFIRIPGIDVLLPSLTSLTNLSRLIIRGQFPCYEFFTSTNQKIRSLKFDCLYVPKEYLDYLDDDDDGKSKRLSALGEEIKARFPNLEKFDARIFLIFDYELPKKEIQFQWKDDQMEHKIVELTDIP